jgi:glycosyltransferase involved in cell wall biosynthesis
MHSPLISIAVPIYNTARYLPAALDSLLAQDYPHWEALLWDDGSSDGSGQIAADYAARDARFRLLGDGNNRGAASVLTDSFTYANGRFLASVDSDDVLETRALSSMLAFMQRHPQLGMCYSQYTEISEIGHHLGLGRRCQTPYSPHHLLLEFMTYQLRMIRKEAYHAVGGIDPNARFAEDYDLCLRLSETCAIGHLPQPLYRYRIRSDSVSSSQRLQQIRATFAASERALQRRGMAASHALSLGIRARHVLKPKPGVEPQA